MQVGMLPELLVNTHQTYPLIAIRLDRYNVLTRCGEDVCCHSELHGLIGQRVQCLGRGEPVDLMSLLDQGDGAGPQVRRVADYTETHKFPPGTAPLTWDNQWHVVGYMRQRNI